MKRKLPPKFVIPDSGPLMSLAMATLGDPAMMASGGSYLDFLKVFGRPIQLIDQIRYECTHRTDKPDAALISRWLARNANMIEDIPTDTGKAFAAALEQGLDPKTRHKGELALDEYLLEFDDYRCSEDEAVVVLFEERKVSRLLDDRRNVRLLSTGAFVRTLEMNRLLSYDAFIDAVRSQDGERGIVLEELLMDRDTDATDADVDWTHDLEI